MDFMDLIMSDVFSWNIVVNHMGNRDSGTGSFYGHLVFRHFNGIIGDHRFVN
jgi:hypothetical protein